MKRIIVATLALVMLAAVLLCGCTPVYEKNPAQYEGIKWVTPDYSFRFKPENECRGNYNFKDVKYNIQVSFDGPRISVKDTGSDKELFYGDWMYEDEKLCVYNIVYNKDDYEDFKGNFAEFYILNQEKL